MPIRLVCPSCSATLSVKDEYAGRAVKCPKCAGVIPPSQSAVPALPPEPVPEPAEPSFEVVDKPAPKAKTNPRPASKPIAKAPAPDEDEEDDEPEKPKKSAKRKRDEDEEERPAKKNKKRRDDDDDRPRKGKKKGGSKLPLVLGVVAVVLLGCCGGGYYLVDRVRQGIRNELSPKNDKVTLDNYEKVQYGMTRAEVEAILGPGKLCTREKFAWIYGDTTRDNIQLREEKWGTRIDRGVVYVWQNESDTALFGFQPDGSESARVRVREFVSKTGTNSLELGEYTDEEFARRFGDGKQPNDPPGKNEPNPIPGSIAVAAEQLMKEYRANETAADKKYKDKTLVVSGTLLMSALDGQQFGITLTDRVFVEVPKELTKGVGTAIQGQKIQIKGRCTGLAGNIVNLVDGEVLSLTPPDSISVSAASLIAEFAKGRKAAENKYEGKLLRVTGARVTAVENASVSLTGATSKGGKLVIKATYFPETKPSFAAVKIGDTITIKGRYVIGSSDEIIIEHAARE